MRKISLYNVLLPILLLSSAHLYSQSVDHLTGRLQMSIPIGQLQANDISVPISLYHHGGTMKVAESNGDCGMGWNLSVQNYGITRIVRGLPDEINTATRKGWLYNGNAASVQSFSPTADDNLTNCSDEAVDFEALEDIIENYQNDTEPDLFYINAPGLSAQFVFDAAGTPRLLTHQDIIIEYTPPATPTSPTSFLVKTNNGFVYNFSRISGISRKSFSKNSSAELTTMREYYKTQTSNTFVDFVSQWSLTTIQSTTTGTTATFNYELGALGGQKNYLSADSTNYILDVGHTQELKSISLKSYTANFIWSNGLLQKISIEESNTVDKREFLFEYISVYKSVSKAFLRNIGFSGGSCQPEEKYTFQYQNINPQGFTVPVWLDWKRNWGQDFFGYPNGSTGNKNLPTLYFYSNETDGRRLRVTPIPGMTVTNEVIGQYRGPNSINYSYGEITKVTYPTGGYVEIQYEGNRYKDNSTGGQDLPGGGLRVRRLISQGTEIAFGKAMTDTNPYHATIKEYEYTLENGTQSGVLLSPINLGYLTPPSSIKQLINNVGDESEILYSRVVEKVSGQGKTVYEFNIPGAFPDLLHGEWKATKSRVARPNPVLNACLPIGSVRNGYYTFPFPPSANYNFKRGQLSKVAEFSQTGTLIREKLFTYAPKTTNPTTIKGIRFEKIDGIYFYGVYELLTGRMEVVSQEVVREASHEDATKWFQTTTAYTYNANHMLETVTTTLPDNSSTVQRFKYARDFQITNPASTDTAAVALKALNDSNRGSELVEQVTKATLPGLSQTVTGGQLIMYRTFENGRTLPYYIKIFPSGADHGEASSIGQTFQSDTDYRLIRTLKAYDSEGRILTESDDKKNHLSYYYATDPSFKIATIYNAKIKQSVIENFEMPSTYGLTVNGTEFLYTNGWTGKRAIALSGSSTTLESSVSDPIQKNGSRYRVSCWVFSIANKSVTFKALVDGNLAGSLTLTNSIHNKWNYLEGEFDVNTASSLFTFKVETNASTNENVILDDVVLIPVEASVSMQTMLPLKGTTSVTDDRGNSVKNTYDGLGRLINTLDQNRNLVQKNEYTSKNVETHKPQASFQTDVEKYIMNEPITFTATSPPPCDVGSTYTWETDGVAHPGSEGTLVHTFTTPGNHSVKLTMTNPSGISASFLQTFCLEYKINGIFTAEIVDGNGNPLGSYDCNYIGAIDPILIPPAGFPEECLESLNWSTTYSPDGAGGTIITYTATYWVSSAYFKGCTGASVSSFSGQASASVTALYNPNCQ